MKIDIDNIGAVQIGNRLYGHVEVDKSVTVDGKTYGIRIGANRHAIGPIDMAPAGKPVLVFSGPVWLGVSAYDVNYDTFYPGGYLDTVQCYTDFTDTDQQGSSPVRITYELLGLVPGPYTGGVRIDGLSLPNVWNDVSSQSDSGHRYNQITGQADSIFTINGSVRLLYALKDVAFRPALPSGSHTQLDSRCPTCFRNNADYTYP